MLLRASSSLTPFSPELLYSVCLLSRIISLIWVYLFLDDEMAQIDRVSSVTRFEDYLSAPVPSAIPSPELQPSQNVHMPDLMNFGNPGKCLTQHLSMSSSCCSNLAPFWSLHWNVSHSVPNRELTAAYSCEVIVKELCMFQAANPQRKSDTPWGAIVYIYNKHYVWNADDL